MTATSSVLIVEDEMIVAEDLSGKLEDQGYSVCAIASTGEGAISETDRHQPSLVLMDIRLAGACDGIEAARQIQKKFDIPIIYLTAHSDETTLSRAKETAPFGFILKPFDDLQLATQVELALIKHGNQRRVKEQQEWLKVTLKSIADAVIATDGDGRILLMNRSAEILTGWSEEEARGKLTKDIYRLVERRRAARRRLSASALLETKCGRRTPVEHAISPIRDTSGKIIGMVITFQDISERMAAEERLEHSRHLLTRAQAMAHVGSWEHDHESGRITWSDEAFRIFGLQPQEVVPSYNLFLQHVHPEDRHYVEKEYNSSLASHHDDYDIEHRIVRADGSIRYLHQRCEHQRDESGAVTLSVGMAHDITEQKLAKQKLEHTNRELEQFASVASHDLQSPLLSLKNLLQLIENRFGERLDQDGQYFIGRAMQSADRMQSLIRNLLNFSRITARQPVRHADLEVLVREVLEAMHSDIAAYGAEVDLQPLPEAPVHADQFKRLLQNLISNGMKYNTSRPPRVTVSCREQQTHYHFRVEDNGIGIEADDHDSVFKLFHRLHSDKEYQGSGMGLAICKKIVEHHGGDIWLESEPGEGTCFHFTLPKG